MEHGLRSGRLFAIMSGEFVEGQGRFFAGFNKSKQAREALLAMRREHDLARGHLAAILSVTTATLSRWEDGKRNPSRAARKLIWFVHQWLGGKLPCDLAEMLTWGKISLS